MAQTPTPAFRRTVYYVQPKGKQVRFTGWAHVTTSLGTCAEPFDFDYMTPGANHPNYDPSDPITRVDRLQQVAEEESPFYDDNGVDRQLVHGGNLKPQVAIKTGNFAD